jgi:hypothetical protein
MTQPTSLSWVAGGAALLMLLVGCSSADGDPVVSDDAEVVVPESEEPQDSAAPDNDAPAEPGVAPEGSVGLVIGEEVWEFDNLACITGLENAQSDVYGFVAYAEGESGDGNKIEFFADIRDDSGEGRLEGDGVVSSITLYFYSGSEQVDGLVAETDLGWDGNTASVKPGDGIVSGEGDFVLDSEYGIGAPSTSGFFTGVCGIGSLG